MADNSLVRNEAWTLSLVEEGEVVLVSAGADELWVLDYLSPAGARRLVEIWNDETAGAFEVAAGDDPGFRRAVSELKSAGALCPGMEPPGPASFAIEWLGEPDAGLSARLDDLGDGRRAGPSERPDLLFVIRRTGRLEEWVGERAGAMDGPHLFVDLATHHTLSIGPLVIPGRTACLNCFLGRIMDRWGDPPTPVSPRVNRETALVAAFLARHLRTFSERGTVPLLIEQSWSLDVDRMTTWVDPVHRLPWCGVCFSEGGESSDGAIAAVEMEGRSA